MDVARREVLTSGNHASIGFASKFGNVTRKSQPDHPTFDTLAPSITLLER
jgi:hypothetical protein